MKIAENISWKTLQDKVVAVNVTTGEYYTMNTVASEIWKAIGDGCQDEEIIQLLEKEYPHTSKGTIEQDYKEQIEYWNKESLIIV